MLYIVTYNALDHHGAQTVRTLYLQAVSIESAESIFNKYVPGYKMERAFKINGTENLAPAVGTYKIFAVYYYDKSNRTALQHKVVIGGWDALTVIVGGVLVSNEFRMFGVRQIH